MPSVEALEWARALVTWFTLSRVCGKDEEEIVQELAEMGDVVSKGGVKGVEKEPEK